MTETSIANPTLLIDKKPVKFRFRKDDMGNQRQTLEFEMPVPSFEGIQSILATGGKGLELLQDAVFDVVRGAMQNYVVDDIGFDSSKFDFSQVSWEAIANRPRAERATVSPEEWKAFAEDYIRVMPGVTGKTEKQVSNACIVYLKKFAQVKTDKPNLQKLQEQLAIYVNQPSADQHTAVLEILLSRLDTYLKADDVKSLIENL